MAVRGQATPFYNSRTCLYTTLYCTCLLLSLKNNQVCLSLCYFIKTSSCFCVQLQWSEAKLSKMYDLLDVVGCFVLLKLFPHILILHLSLYDKMTHNVHKGNGSSFCYNFEVYFFLLIVCFHLNQVTRQVCTLFH